MKYLLTLLILLNAHTLNAIELDVGIGYTMTAMPENGLWYQKEFEHSIDRDSPSFHIGARFHATESIDLLFGYKHLGKFKSNAMASASDYNYADYEAGRAEIWPLTSYKTKGKAHGVYALAQYNYKTVFIKAGWWVHQSPFRVNIKESNCTSAGNGYCQSPFSGGNPEPEPDFSVKASDNWNVGAVVGVGFKLNKFSVSYEIWDIQTDTAYSPFYKGKAQNIVLTYTF